MMTALVAGMCDHYSSPISLACMTFIRFGEKPVPAAVALLPRPGRGTMTEGYLGATSTINQGTINLGTINQGQTA